MGARGPERVHYFGEFSLSRSARTLSRKGELISLTPKEFETLLLLVECAGNAVKKEELIRTIWPDTFVGDGSLARNISVLRKHLGAEAIQTIPKFGYRFSLPVSANEGGSALETRTSDAPAQVAEMLPMAGPTRVTPIPWLGAVVALLAGLLLTGFVIRYDRLFKGETPKLAVLPFRNLSMGPAANDYLRDGLADELTARLSRLDYTRVKVLARGSTRQYLGSSKTPAQISSELRAKYLLDGSVAFDDEGAHLSVELINGPDESILWSKHLSGPVADLSSMQEQIVQSVEASTHAAPQRRVTDSLPGETTIVEAHDAYLRGRFCLEQKTLASEQQALVSFQSAVKLDPRYARAYEGISETYIFMAGYILPQKPFSLAREAAETAIRLNEQLGEAHRDLAWTLFNGDSELGLAETEYRRSIELNPDDARAHHWYAQLLAAERRSVESLQESTAGYQLDPRSTGSVQNYGFMLIEAGQAGEGIKVLEDLLKREPSSDVIWGYVAIGYSRLGRYDKAAWAFDKAVEISPVKSGYEAAFAYALAMNGDTVKARTIVQKLEKNYAAGTWVPGEAMTVAYIGLGEKEAAFEWLQRGVADRGVTLLEANTEPIYSAFNGDPRFTAILVRLGLPHSG